MRNTVRLFVAVLVLCAFCVVESTAQQGKFAKLVHSKEKIAVKTVTQTSPLKVPFITWGGDMATFHANGGLKTKPGTIFADAGLKLELTPGDDFVQQVRDYISGKTPFLRGTFRMIGMAGEVIGADPRTQGVVIMQMTWSAGDHMVGRSAIKTANDLKGKTFVLQECGPHVGMLDDLLTDLNLTWDNINEKWAKELTATDNSPLAIFKKDPSIDACFVITPDMVAITGGLEKVGTGTGGTVKGARVVTSTAYRTRCIADVYVCRKDFFDKNPALVAKFVNAYFRGCEEVMQLKDNVMQLKDNKDKKNGSKVKYNALLKLTQSIYGKEVIPTDADADGLLADCTMVLYPGNVKFFTWTDIPMNFDRFAKKSTNLAVKLRYANAKPKPLVAAWGKYEMSAIKEGLVNNKEPVRPTTMSGGKKRKDELDDWGDTKIDPTLLAYAIQFPPRGRDFPIKTYGWAFQKAVDTANQHRDGAFFHIRGHADPTLVIRQFLKVGLATGLLTRQGVAPNWVYTYKGQKLDMNNTKAIIALIKTGAFSKNVVKDADGNPIDPKLTMQAALNLSKLRAENVRKSLFEYAKKKGLILLTGMVPEQCVEGIGIAEPIIPRPTNMAEARQNMRVEFRLLRVKAETTTFEK
ncbi:MAG: ABC transporter substrate-binding protein [Planctomycetes bacterium]|nr:ABC transporter substrate-binding protein [Planctomycetota bacterium]